MSQYVCVSHRLSHYFVFHIVYLIIFMFHIVVALFSCFTSHVSFFCVSHRMSHFCVFHREQSVEIAVQSPAVSSAPPLR